MNLISNNVHLSSIVKNFDHMTLKWLKDAGWESKKYYKFDQSINILESTGYFVNEHASKFIEFFGGLFSKKCISKICPLLLTNRDMTFNTDIIELAPLDDTFQGLKTFENILGVSLCFVGEYLGIFGDIYIGENGKMYGLGTCTHLIGNNPYEYLRNLSRCKYKNLDL